MSRPKYLVVSLFVNLSHASLVSQSFRAEFYERHCGAKLEHVLKTIQLAKQLGYWVEVCRVDMTP